MLFDLLDDPGAVYQVDKFGYLGCIGAEQDVFWVQSEPDYPYFKGIDNHGVSDDKSSLLGPAPGFVPGGPNSGYSGDAVPPLGAVYLNRFYRDWCDQIVWTARTWEITENSIGYQGPYVALAAAFVPPRGEFFADGFETGDTSAWSATVP